MLPEPLDPRRLPGRVTAAPSLSSEQTPRHGYSTCFSLLWSPGRSECHIHNLGRTLMTGSKKTQKNNDSGSSTSSESCRSRAAHGVAQSRWLLPCVAERFPRAVEIVRFSRRTGPQHCIVGPHVTIGGNGTFTDDALSRSYRDAIDSATTGWMMEWYCPIRARMIIGSKKWQLVKILAHLGIGPGAA